MRQVLFETQALFEANLSLQKVLIEERFYLMQNYLWAFWRFSYTGKGN